MTTNSMVALSHRSIFPAPITLPDLTNRARLITRVAATQLRDVVQRALAELEGGAGAVLTNTGMSADSSGNHRLFETGRFAGCAARLLRR